MLNFDDMDMAISRTEQKKAHERLQALAEPLANLGKKESKLLPASEYFVDALVQLDNITSNEARKRHIKRLGKLLAEEDPHDIVEFLFDHLFSPEQIAKVESWQTRLNIEDDNTIKQFNKIFFNSEVNTVRQLLIWVQYAKHIQDDELLRESTRDLHTYIRQVAILSRDKKL